MNSNFTRTAIHKGPGRRFLEMFLLSILFLLLSPLPRNLQAYAASGFPEYQVKAELLFRLAELIDWPPASDVASAPFVIAIVGKNPFDSYLFNRAQSEKIHNRQVKIEVFEDSLLQEEIQMIFISKNETRNISKIIQQFAGKSVLIVGDSHELAQNGAHIGLRVIEGRIGFSLNLISAQTSRLRISPSILRLATQIFGDRK